jgi:hypothetical protein
MTNEEIAKRIAWATISPNGGEGDLFYAIQLFVERVVLPPSVKEYDLRTIESYIRDALQRGTDHWEVCSPADTEVSSFADDEDAVTYVGGARGKKILSE